MTAGPAPVGDRELALRVRDLLLAGQLYQRAVAAALRISVPDAAAMDHLYHAGPVTPTAIAEVLSLTTASVTGLLDRLAAAEYVTRAPHPRDRRSVLITLTDVGTRAMWLLFDDFAAALDQATATATPADRHRLHHLLTDLVTALHDRAGVPRPGVADSPPGCDPARTAAASAPTLEET